MRQYATTADYWSRYGNDIGVTDAQLQRASLALDSLLIGAVYDVDDHGMPTKPDAIDALRDATIAQAHAVAVETTKNSGGITPDMIASAQILSAQYTLRAPAETKQGLSSNGYSWEALDILRVAGLLRLAPNVWG